MKRRHNKVNRAVLSALALLSLAAAWLLTLSVHTFRARYFDEKRAAVELTRTALRELATLREQRGVPVDTVNDPNRTGLIGQQFTPLVYGRTDLSDALTTTNPNFAAALVEMLHEAGLKKGDAVGFSWDGTFPAVNAGLLSAARVMELEPRIVTAMSAGSWGANVPGLDWLELERALYERGVFKARTSMATLGGADDAGQALSPDARMMLAAVAESCRVPLVVPATLRVAESSRLREFAGVKALVSVGWVTADLGGPLVRAPSKVLFRPWSRADSSGVLAALLSRHVPVIRIGNPTAVAHDYGLPVAPEPLPEPGRGRLFFVKKYSVGLAAAMAAVLLALLWLVVRYDVEWYLGDRRPREEDKAV